MFIDFIEGKGGGRDGRERERETSLGSLPCTPRRHSLFAMHTITLQPNEPPDQGTKEVFLIYIVPLFISEILQIIPKSTLLCLQVYAICCVSTFEWE